MNLNIKLDIDPKQFGLSGSFAVCVFCAKGTVYNICCNTYKGLIEIDEDNVDAIAREYAFTADQFDDLYDALLAYSKEIGSKNSVIREAMLNRLARFEG